MSGVVLFHLYRGTYKYAVSHTVVLLIGAILLWILCAANMEFAAHALLIMPVMFFVFLLALIFYDQTLFDIQRVYKNTCDDTSVECTTVECESDNCAA